MTTEALQDRRRHETEREIRDAALTLFEERGVSGTTVDDIAHAAGVSPRTVFRYASTKERAALIPHPDLDARVHRTLASLDVAAPLLPQLQSMWREVLDALEDGRSAAGRDALRLWRLVPREPSLLLASLAVDEERLGHALAVLVDDLGIDPLTARVALETAAGVVRVALVGWHDARPDSTLVAIYDRAWAVLRDQL